MKKILITALLLGVACPVQALTSDKKQQERKKTKTEQDQKIADKQNKKEQAKKDAEKQLVIVERDLERVTKKRDDLLVQIAENKCSIKDAKSAQRKNAGEYDKKKNKDQRDADHRMALETAKFAEGNDASDIRTDLKRKQNHANSQDLDALLKQQLRLRAELTDVNKEHNELHARLRQLYVRAGKKHHLRDKEAEHAARLQVKGIKRVDTGRYSNEAAVRAEKRADLRRTMKMKKNEVLPAVGDCTSKKERAKKDAIKARNAEKNKKYEDEKAAKRKERDAARAEKKDRQDKEKAEREKKDAAEKKAHDDKKAKRDKAKADKKAKRDKDKKKDKKDTKKDKKSKKQETAKEKQKERDEKRKRYSQEAADNETAAQPTGRRMMNGN